MIILLKDRLRKKGGSSYDTVRASSFTFPEVYIPPSLFVHKFLLYWLISFVLRRSKKFHINNYILTAGQITGYIPDI